MVFAAELAAAGRTLDRADADRHRGLITAMGLPTSYRGDWRRCSR